MTHAAACIAGAVACTHRQIHRQTDAQMHRQTGRQADRQAGEENCAHVYDLPLYVKTYLLTNSYLRNMVVTSCLVSGTYSSTWLTSAIVTQRPSTCSMSLLHRSGQHRLHCGPKDTVSARQLENACSTAKHKKNGSVLCTVRLWASRDLAHLRLAL